MITLHENRKTDPRLSSEPCTYWLIDLRFYVQLDTNRSFLRRSPQVGMEKLNLTQQKHAFINQKKSTITSCKHTQKSKARFSQLLRNLGWKWREPILISVLHKFVIYLLICHLHTALGPHGATKPIMNAIPAFATRIPHHTTTVLRLFFHPGEPVPEENFWTLWW